MAGISVVIAFIVLGGVREIIFVNINEQIEYDAGRKAAYHVLPHLQFLGEYSLAGLDRAKWILTIVTMLLNFCLSLFTLVIVIKNKPAIRWLIFLYLAGFAAAGLSFGIGRTLSDPQLGYTVARAIMGGLQSPFPLMMLIPALYLEQRKDGSMRG